MTAEAQELFAAVSAGDLGRVRQILSRHPETAAARDDDGATALHFAAESGRRPIVQALLAAGADINARDARFGATPSGWAIEYLRTRGGLLAIEIEDALHAIARGDAELVRRYLERFPALRTAVGTDGAPLAARAGASGNAEIRRLFDSPPPTGAP